MRNIYPDLIIKVLSGNKKNYICFPDLSCMHRCTVSAYMQATFLVREIADRFLGQALYG